MNNKPLIECSNNPLEMCAVNAGSKDNKHFQDPMVEAILQMKNFAQLIHPRNNQKLSLEKFTGGGRHKEGHKDKSRDNWIDKPYDKHLVDKFVIPSSCVFVKQKSRKMMLPHNRYFHKLPH